LSKRRRDEAAEFALEQRGKGQRRAVLEIGSDDLHTDRQAGFAAPDRHHGGRQPEQGRDARPHDLVGIGERPAVDIEPPPAHFDRVVVGKGRCRHRRAQHDVEFREQGAPALAQVPADAVGAQPVAVAERAAAQPERAQAAIVGRNRARLFLGASVFRLGQIGRVEGHQPYSRPRPTIRRGRPEPPMPASGRRRCAPMGRRPADRA
jgi:hypothetical protein